MTQPAPLILTLSIDARSFAFFDAQRRRYFPQERNFIPAHITLFHHLPGEHVEIIQSDIGTRCAIRHPFVLDVTGLRSLGRGVAYTLASGDLARLRGELAERWADWLTPQDRQRHQPHVTVQNKVDPEAARALLARLAEDFRPFQVTGTGLDLWRYRGGPWETVQRFCFAGG